MNRRSFLKLSALGGGAAAFLPTLNLFATPTPFPRPFEAGDILYSQMLADVNGCGLIIFEDTHGWTLMPQLTEKSLMSAIERTMTSGEEIDWRKLPLKPIKCKIMPDAVHMDRLIQDYVLPQNKNIPPSFIGEMQKATARRNQRRT